MHMNKKTLIMMMLPFLLTACSGNTDPTNTSGTSGGGDEPVIVIDKDEYDEWANSWSKPGHLYFHYNRGDKKGYENYCLWMWQHDPQDLEGALYAYSSKTDVSSDLTLVPMTNHWMKASEVGKEGDDMYIDTYSRDYSYGTLQLRSYKPKSSGSFSIIIPDRININIWMFQ